MVHSISILGSTGSIGRQTVAVAEHLGLNVRALTTNRNIQLAEEQARRLHPAFVAVTDEASAKALRIALADTDIAVGGGENALCEAAVHFGHGRGRHGGVRRGRPAPDACGHRKGTAHRAGQ